MPTHQTVLLAPPKSVFQFLSDPTLIEEFTKWKVDAVDGFDEGTAWTERRRLRSRSWRVTAFDRRGLSYTMEGPVAVTFTCKKGGRGACNVQMRIEGEAKAMARFEKTDGDRLERLKAWLEA